jgi:polyisoprenoid-binding protein YceI
MIKRSNIVKTAGILLINLLFISLFPLAIAGETTEVRSGVAEIKVTGTSTLHDWEMESASAGSEIRLRLDEDGRPTGLESVEFRLKKTTLKSDKSGLDRRAYEALDAKRHPEIIFRSNGNGSIEKNGDNYRLSTSGELTIAGVTRTVSLNATCTDGADGTLVCSGSSQLKMSDFNIDPPVMFLGTLRTADEITVEYRIVH